MNEPKCMARISRNGRCRNPWLAAILMAYSEFGDVPHPLPEWVVQLCESKETP